jgi:hypothetical protein
MAFALWVDEETAWAEGTHEYRPMGVAVIAATNVFRPRDFAPARRAPPREASAFAGLFASLEAVNEHLKELRSQPKRKNLKQGLSRLIPII